MWNDGFQLVVLHSENLSIIPKTRSTTNLIPRCHVQSSMQYQFQIKTFTKWPSFSTRVIAIIIYFYQSATRQMRARTKQDKRNSWERVDSSSGQYVRLKAPCSWLCNERVLVPCWYAPYIAIRNPTMQRQQSPCRPYPGSLRHLQSSFVYHDAPWLYRIFIS